MSCIKDEVKSFDAVTLPAHRLPMNVLVLVLLLVMMIMMRSYFSIMLMFSLRLDESSLLHR
jgi:hypothetical protein